MGDTANWLCSDDENVDENRSPLNINLDNGTDFLFSTPKRKNSVPLLFQELLDTPSKTSPENGDYFLLVDPQKPESPPSSPVAAQPEPTVQEAEAESDTSPSSPTSKPETVEISSPVAESAEKTPPKSSSPPPEPISKPKAVLKPKPKKKKPILVVRQLRRKKIVPKIRNSPAAPDVFESYVPVANSPARQVAPLNGHKSRWSPTKRRQWTADEAAHCCKKRNFDPREFEQM